MIFSHQKCTRNAHAKIKNGLISTFFRHFSQVRVLYRPPWCAAKIDTHTENPETTTVSGFFRARFWGWNIKTPKWISGASTGLEPMPPPFWADFSKIFRGVGLFCSSNCELFVSKVVLHRQHYPVRDAEAQCLHWALYGQRRGILSQAKSRERKAPQPKGNCTNAAGGVFLTKLSKKFLFFYANAFCYANNLLFAKICNNTKLHIFLFINPSDRQ